MGRHRGSLRWVEFEVSEAIVMTCGPHILDQLQALRADGATIAIDDFGAGFSSLARLRSFPVDQVKLDACLIADIESDPAAREIVQAVIGLIHGLGATAVAEGVETAGQLEMLRVMGCDAAQGFVVAPPMFETDYGAWVESGRAAQA